MRCRADVLRDPRWRNGNAALGKTSSMLLLLLLSSWIVGSDPEFAFFSACEESVYKVGLVINYKDSAADGIKHQHLPS